MGVRTGPSDFGAGGDEARGVSEARDMRRGGAEPLADV